MVSDSRNHQERDAATRRSRLGRSAAFHILAQVAQAGGPIAVLLILARTLDPAEFGAVGVLQFAIALAVPLVGGSLHGAVGRDLFDRSPQEVRLASGASLFLIASGAAILAGLVLVLAPAFGGFEGLGVPVLFIGVATAAARAVGFLRVTIYQMEGRATSVLLWHVALASSLLVGALVGVHLVGGVLGFAIGQGCATGVVALIAIGLLLRDGRVDFSLDRASLRAVVRFGGPLVPHAFALALLPSAGRAAVAHVESLERSGAFTLAQQLAMVVMFGGAAIHQAFVPWMFGARGGDATCDLQKGARFIRRLLFALFGLAVVTGLAAPTVASWIAPDIPSAGLAALWLSLGFFAQTAYMLESARLFYLRRTGAVASASTLVAFVHAPAVFLATRIAGIEGAAFATMIAFSLLHLRTRQLADRHEAREIARARSHAEPVSAVPTGSGSV